MSRTKHTKAQIIAAVKQIDVAREFRVSTHTICGWKSEYGGMDVSEAQEAKRLRDENSRFRKRPTELGHAAGGMLFRMTA